MMGGLRDWKPCLLAESMLWAISELQMTHPKQAANDAGTSVRKRAVKILWESCIRCAAVAVLFACVRLLHARIRWVLMRQDVFRRLPDFPRATEACIRVLQRVSDPEESIHHLVRKIFHDLWFSTPTNDDTICGSPASRADQLVRARCQRCTGGPLCQ